MTCLEVIEHLKTPGLMLSEAKRVLKDGGHIVISTPNCHAFTWKLRNVLMKTGLLYWLYSGKWLPKAERRDEAIYDIDRLGQLLQSYGFHLVQVSLLKIFLPRDDILVCARKTKT